MRASDDTPQNDSADAQDGGRTVVGLIRALQSGEIDPPGLTAPDRRRVVEHLWGEGYSVTETAEIVKAAERTILRDRAAIKQTNAVQPGEQFVPETVGALLRQADLTVARLRRLARDKATPAAAKVNAELGCWTVAKELVAALQSLAYLPTAPTRFQGEVRVEEAMSYDELQTELDRVGGIVAAAGDAQVMNSLGQMRDTVQRLALGEQIKKLKGEGEDHE